MRLALALGGRDQGGIVQPFGAFEDRTGHLDVVVVGQPADHADGSVRRIRQPDGQPGAGLGFDREKAKRAASGLREASKGITLGGLEIKDLINEGRR